MTQKTKKAGQWDFDGSCAPRKLPGGGWTSGPGDTFTLGIFQWVPMARGARLKRGRVQQRIKGFCHDPAPAFAQAQEIVNQRNAGAAP